MCGLVTSNTYGRPTTIIGVVHSILTMGVGILGIFAFKDRTKCLYIVYSVFTGLAFVTSLTMAVSKLYLINVRICKRV